MVAKIRNIPKQFKSEYQSKFKNLLVSGASFTWNNSDVDICRWPYYLRDIGNFEQVFDCSQSGAGSNHIFNSVINECETNPDVDPNDTLVVIMWPELSRTDTITLTSVTKARHHCSNYAFDERFSTLTINNITTGGKNIVDDLCKLYKRVVDMDAQIYESSLKIIGLNSYLDKQGFTKVFVFDSDRTKSKLELLPKSLQISVLETMTWIAPLGEFAIGTGQLEPDNVHPTPDGYLDWTRQYLAPTLQDLGLLSATQM
jgi:hypothetical protein